MGHKSCSIRLKLMVIMLFAGFFFLQESTAQTELIIPGGDWRDTGGKLIVATEGGIIKVDDLYYLWGMDRSANNYAFVGINLYSSPDLKNWTFVNQILKKTSHTDLNNDAVIERAKILHNKKNGKFIIWMHYEGHNAYSVAEVAYAICDSIGGNFTFKTHFRPMNIDSRDINVYQDDDGKAYLICTTKGNQNVSLFELDDDYTGIVREVYRGSASNDMECEGHAIIKTGGYYFWLMSWCTGWDFNDNHYFYSKSLAGPWDAGGNIAVANTHTYESQVGFAVTVKGSEKTTFLYTGDRWSVNNYSMSRVVLLPIEVNGTKLSVKWNDQYNLDAQTGVWTPAAQYFTDGVYTITAKHSGLVLGTNGSAVQQQTFTGAENQLWRIQNIGASHFKISSVASGKVMDISGASREVGAKLLQYEWSDDFNQKWQLIDCGNGYHRFVSVNTLGKALEVSGGSKNTGTDAVLGNFSYKDNQLWQIASADSKIKAGSMYMIVNRGSEKAITAGSELATLTAPRKSTEQVWKIEDLYNGYFAISNVDGRNALDNKSSVQEGSQLSSGSVTKKFSQQWQLIKIGTDYYKIVNRISGKVLDSKDGSIDEGNPVIQYTDKASSSNNQQWSLVAVDQVSTGHSGPGNSRQINDLKKSAYYVIYDLHGRIIRHGNSDLQEILNRNVLSHGIYMIRRTDKHKIECSRVLVE